MTSSLPRKCSTPELQQRKRVKGIEPSYSAWKAAALPLSYTRDSHQGTYITEVSIQKLPIASSDQNPQAKRLPGCKHFKVGATGFEPV